MLFIFLLKGGISLNKAVAQDFTVQTLEISQEKGKLAGSRSIVKSADQPRK